jgi:hypothetical protein
MKTKQQLFKVKFGGPVKNGIQRYLFIAEDATTYWALGCPERVREFPNGTEIKLPVEGTVEHLTSLGFSSPSLMPAVKGWNRKGTAPLKVMADVWPAKPKKSRKAAA